MQAAELSMLARNGADGEWRPQVDEIIICSPRGEVLCEWHCKNNSVRLHLLTQLPSQASRLGRDLRLDVFDRFEASGPDTRIVVQIQPAHTMYIHTTAVPDLEMAANDQS